MQDYKLVLGLEVHLHVKTKTKMFCGCSSDIYAAAPNTHTCPVCLGLPGALPVANEEAIRKVQLLGLACNSELNLKTNFDRKHYFYHDLAKGYQISQYKDPFCVGGFITLDSGFKVELERIHLEEDTAKSIHDGEHTLIDFNMGGMPLIELVTKPVFTSSADASEFARKLRDLVRYLDIGEGDMQKGQLRIEPNISVRTAKMAEMGTLPSYKVEVKNINSFKYMEKAVDYEFRRQADLLARGQQPLQENRGWDEKRNETVAQRSKEEAHDYRYFPEPDIPLMVFDATYVEKLRTELPELPQEIRLNLAQNLGLTSQNAAALTTYPGLELLVYFNDLVKETAIEPNKIANLVLNKENFRGLSAQVFEAQVAEAESSIQDSSTLAQLLDEVISENSHEFTRYKNGETKLAQFFLGQLMRKTSGKASPQVVFDLLSKKVSE